MDSSNNNWESFNLQTVRPTVSDAVNLLNQIEDQGYDPRFMFLTQQGVQVYGKKKEPEHRRLGPQEPASSESEPNFDLKKLTDWAAKPPSDIEGFGGSDFPQ